MRLWWPAWGGRTARRSANSGDQERVGRTRGRSASRPRVARAVAAAQAAQSGASLHMGVGSGDGTGDEMARVWRARESGPLLSARHTGQRDTAGVSAGLLWATAHAARVSGREPADVWAEALDAWLTGWEHDGTGEPSERRVADGRRLRTWQAIDTTLGQLRAS